MKKNHIATSVQNAIAQPTHTMEPVVNMKNKQRGAMLLDNMIAVGFVAVVLIGIVASIPKISYMMNLTEFQKQEAEIASATVSWKKKRPNYTGVSMILLCDRQLVSKSICGTAGDGKLSNPFGGDWTVTGVGGHYQVTATLTNLDGETGRLWDVADSMAPSTRLQCSSADGCGSITGAGTKTLTMVH